MTAIFYILLWGEFLTENKNPIEFASLPAYGFVVQLVRSNGQQLSGRHGSLRSLNLLRIILQWLKLQHFCEDHFFSWSLTSSNLFMYFIHFRQQRWDTLTTPSLKNQSPEAQGQDVSQGSYKLQTTASLWGDTHMIWTFVSYNVFIGSLKKPRHQSFSVKDDTLIKQFEKSLKKLHSYFNRFSRRCRLAH